MNLKNIILIVLLLCCIGGCKMSCNKIDNLASEYKEKINALPELTTAQQIKDTLESSESKLYVISGYRFPKIESVVKDNTKIVEPISRCQYIVKCFTPKHLSPYQIS